MPRQILRDYQVRGQREVFTRWREGARCVLVVSPTGSGKTTIFCDVASSLRAPVVILVHRRELATQAANRLREFGTDFGFIMAGERPKPYARVQIASVQTLVRRAARPPAGLVVCDEAHLSTAKTWATILGYYPDARILGCTATPWRLSGKPLVGTYDAAVVVATPRQLREQGHLCDYAGFSYLAPDLSQVETTAGDYNEKQSEAAMRQPSIVANIVEKWLAHARELSTVVFAVTVEHSKALCAEFRAAGVAAEHLDGSTSIHERAAILKRVESGATRVLCNVGVAVEGIDIPRLKCCVDANPTKSLARALQKWGRVRRPWQGVKARIHDHAFNIKLHGLPDADRDYSLNAKPEKPPSLNRCEECLAVYDGPRCPACDHSNRVTITGEREIVSVADAESFDFDSSVEMSNPVEVKAPEDSGPVDVRWDKPGRVYEGIFLGTASEQASFGPRKIHVLKGDKRFYRLPGTAQLDAFFAQLSADSEPRVRVVYEHERIISGGRSKKFFRFEVDDGA